MRRLASVALSLALCGCDLAPRYVQPTVRSPGQWPVGEAYRSAVAATEDTPAMSWKTLVSDPSLRRLITDALASNQNLAATVANVASVRAEYRIQRASQFPTLTGDAGATITRGLTSSRSNSSSYDADAGISSFEIDLFGRLKNLSKQAFEQYMATDAGMRSARITLIAQTATEYVTLASDRDLLAIAKDTVASGTRSLQLTQSLHRAGLAAGTDVSDAETVVAQAQSDIESYTTLVAQDRNALDLLVGRPTTDAELPASLGALDTRIAKVPAGLSSAVLLRRPDVLEAEHQLKGANASIGAARAAFFPTITLTSALGFASSALSSLFTGGALSFTGTPQASVPILGGTTRGNLQYAKAQRDYYLATYRYTVQTAFREVADGLARRGTIDRQRAAQDRLVAAAATSYRLADAQYRVGSDTYLNALTAQRTLYSARQTRVGSMLSELTNRLDLYEYLAIEE